MDKEHVQSTEARGALARSSLSLQHFLLNYTMRLLLSDPFINALTYLLLGAPRPDGSDRSPAKHCSIVSYFLSPKSITTTYEVRLYTHLANPATLNSNARDAGW